MDNLSLEIALPDGRKLTTEIGLGEAFVGREPENEIQVDSEAVSRRHGRLFRAGESWLYQDLGSSNGSSVNGVKLPAEKRHLLRSGDVLKLGDASIKMPRDLSRGLGNPQEHSLLIFIDSKFFREVKYGEQGVRLIFGGSGEFEIPGVGAEESVEVATLGGRLTLDNFSRGVQVAVNRHRVGGTVALHDRDEAVVGPYTVVVNSPSSESQHVNSASQFGQDSGRSEGVTAQGFHGSASGDSADDPRAWRADLERRQAEKGRGAVLGSGLASANNVGLGSREGVQLANTTANRFSGIHARPESTAEQSEFRANLTTAFGAIVVLGGLAGLIYWFLS